MSPVQCQHALCVLSPRCPIHVEQHLEALASIIVPSTPTEPRLEIGELSRGLFRIGAKHVEKLFERSQDVAEVDLVSRRVAVLLLFEMPEPGHPLEGLIRLSFNRELGQPQHLLEVAGVIDLVEYLDEG